MLTSDLLRVQVKKGQVTPQYIDPQDAQALEMAARLCACFKEYGGRPRGELLDAIEDFIGFGTDFLIWRGLSKLLYDRSEFTVDAPVDPSRLRGEVFDLAHAMGPVTTESGRRKVFEAAAAKLELEGVTPDQLSHALYADLDARKVLSAHKALAPQELLHRYNLALAQAVLYQATSLEITLEERDPNLLRYLFQSLKFRRLMHRAWRQGPSSWRLQVDGPMSMFSQSRKYGLQMSTFLPSLVLLGEWEMTATLQWKKTKKPHTMTLSSADGLVSHYRAKGQWLSDEERMLESRFAKKVKKDPDFPWRLERRGTLVELGDGEVLIPDYVLAHQGGAKVMVEVIGFWRKAYIERRLDYLERQKDLPLILVVSQRLSSQRERYERASPHVFFYKGVIALDALVEAAQGFI